MYNVRLASLAELLTAGNIFVRNRRSRNCWPGHRHIRTHTMLRRSPYLNVSICLSVCLSLSLLLSVDVAFFERNVGPRSIDAVVGLELSRSFHTNGKWASSFLMHVQGKGVKGSICYDRSYLDSV